MIKVIPGEFSFNETDKSTDLVFSNNETGKKFKLSFPLETAKKIELEIRGLSSDRCGEHHLVTAVACASGMRIASLILSMVKEGWIAARLRLEPQIGSEFHASSNPTYVSTDVGAAIALAIHISLPIFIDENCTEIESAHRHNHHDNRATNASDSGEESLEVPEIFRKAIDEIDGKLDSR